MVNEQNRYVETCPVGCKGSLQPTDIILSEGCLLRCSVCGQLISQCSKSQYQQSMNEFDNPKGTLSDGDAVERHYRRTGKWLFQIASKLDKPSHEIHLLDVGCSSGAFLSVANNFGFQAEGVEPAPQAAQSACSSGLKVHQGFLEDIKFPSNKFDAVTMFEVIEHVRDALSLLSECHRIIKSGGLLMIGTANTDSWTARTMKSHWEYFDISRHGGHISFFNPQSIRVLAQKCGFKVDSIKTHSVLFLEKEDSSAITYRAAKLITELLNMPSRIVGKGHDMLIFLQKP
ncbi:MAG: class I SAM-dependent methyltransferase [Deltaproteobacteria bacterium]|nr:class I SAM-dependent methyltransferase [Deltaproteobacteria bacterium]